MAYFKKDDFSVKEAFKKFLDSKNVIEQCTEGSLMRLNKLFSDIDGRSMNEAELQSAFVNVLKINIPSEEFHILFKKMNLRGDGFVTWDEFISHLLLEYREKDETARWATLELPLSGHPEIRRTRHRTAVCKIVFYPEVLPDRSSSFQRGCYLTVSKDGLINFWSLDLEYQRSVRSENPYLKVQSTVITDIIAMPDVQIICTSSTEYDLRFYDTAAKKFELRVLISRLEDAVVCMYYHFSSDIQDDSYIILGDTRGSLKVMSFNPTDYDPFKQKSDRQSTHIHYEAVLKGELKGLKVREIRNVHTNWVSQVSYYASLRALVSSSRCSDCSLLVSDPTGTKMQYKFLLPLGISCFTFCEESQLLVTGGPDCIVRTWNPFVPRRANVVLHGHQAGICALIVQYAGKRLYSLSNDRCVKVWDIVTQSCVQTYNELPSELSEHSPMTVLYNTLTHKMIIAGMMIAVLVCEKVISEETSDGYTHAKSVSCVLYNKLFKMIVTAGFDSCIMVWDPWLGKRLQLIKNAHSRPLHGFYINVEITAAAFDLAEHLLLTGARDGILKMWNFRTGHCLRKMAIDAECEVTSIVCLENRILCTGWDRRVTEFAASGTEMCRKNWETRHTDDVLCSAIFHPTTFASGSQDGEIILWRLETGQLYRKYRATDPTGRFIERRKSGIVNEYVKSMREIETQTSNRNFPRSARYSYCAHQESVLNVARVTAVRSMIFLTERPVAPEVGTLLVSLESGLIQVWSHHPAGGFLFAFSALHARGDSAISMTTDPMNHFLVTGHRVGYIKVWYLANYALPSAAEPCMPLLRLEFPFLWRDRIDGRAKRAVRDQPLPMLLTSLRGHREAVTSLQVIPDARIIVSGSKDRTVRLWTFGGRYISTLGTIHGWSAILPDRAVFQYFRDYRLPADIKRTASFTTMKVLQGGRTEMRVEETDDVEFTKEIPEEERHLLCGKRLTVPILGHSYKLPPRIAGPDEPLILDTSLPFIPVYAHLTTHSLQSIELPEWLANLLKRELRPSKSTLSKSSSKSLRLLGKKSREKVIS